MNKSKRLLYVRSAPYKVSIDGYNLQEIGFCKALCRYGYQCDILYYSNEDRDEVIYSEKKGSVRILWRKGIRILRSGIYPRLLKQNFINQYDLIILTEYDQIMTYLISKCTNKSVLYNGPYYNLFKIPILEPIYCKLFNSSINKNINIKLVKSQLSKEYLEARGFENVKVIGVGLDESKFINCENQDYGENFKVKNILDFMGDNSLLYIGSLIDRKNTEFIFKIFNRLRIEGNRLKLIIIGRGSRKYTEKCFSFVEEKYKKDILHIEFLENKFLKKIYEKAKIFLLPSKKEIFGMVLLEAMYFGVPVISSYNGGSSVLIDNGVDGVIIDNYNEEDWERSILDLVNNDELCREISKNAMKKIRDKFLWDKVAEQFIKILVDMQDDDV